MPDKPKLEVDAHGLPLDPQAREVAIGRMVEKLTRIEQERARKEAEEQARLEAEAKQAPPDPLVRIEWLKSPQRGSCQIQSKAGLTYYKPRPHKGGLGAACTTECRHGPVIQKATNRVVKPGTGERVPADHARILAEAQFVRVTEGFELVRWTDSDVGSGIDPGPDPNDPDKWAALAHS